MLTVDIEKIPFYQDGLKEGIAQGLEKGKNEAMKFSVKAFSSLGYEVENIAKLLHLSEDEVCEFLK